jgi:hypothetical protein
MILSEGLELNVALVGEINKLEFEVVPVVEGEGVGVDLLVERQPLQGALVLELTRSRNAVVFELSLMGVGDVCRRLLALSRLADGGGEEDAVLLIEDVGNQEEAQDEDDASASLSHLLMEI